MKDSRQLLFGGGWLLTGKFVTLIRKKKGGGIRNLPPEVCVRRVGRVSRTNMIIQYNLQKGKRKFSDPKE